MATAQRLAVKKASSRQESNPGHLWLEPPVLCHWATTAGQPPALTILYMYCTSGTECLSHTPGSHPACAIRTLLGVDRKILSIRKEPMLSGLLTLNAQSISPHAGNKSICYVMRRKHATGNKETVSIAGRDPTRGPRVHYCYSTALQNVVSMWKIVYFRVKYTDHAHTGT